MQFFSRFILRFAGTIALVGTLPGVVGGYYSVKLFKNLKTDFEELLPTDSRSVLDLDEVRGRLQSIDSLGVLVFSKDINASKRFIDDLASELQKAPKDITRSTANSPFFKSAKPCTSTCLT
jgi:predicted RND superfamily exporter protein